MENTFTRLAPKETTERSINRGDEQQTSKLLVEEIFALLREPKLAQSKNSEEPKGREELKLREATKPSEVLSRREDLQPRDELKPRDEVKPREETKVRELDLSKVFRPNFLAASDQDSLIYAGDRFRKGGVPAAGGAPGVPPREPYSIIPPYLLRELSRRNPTNPDFMNTIIKTRDLPPCEGSCAGDAKREVYDAKGKEDLPGDKVRVEGQKPTGDKEVDDAYEFTGAVRDYFKAVHGRNSIDGKGMKLISTVNYGDNYENAFWNGKQMTYGRPGKDSPFKTFVLLDVAGHEIAHGVTEKVSNMEYYGQSGALNESMSDVFGELIQQRAKNIKAKDADWVIGDGLWKDNVKGAGLRNMLKPGTAYDDPAIGKDPQPAHMKDYVKTEGDNGGVHYNSGIPNRAFAEFAVAVGGNAWDKPGQIWYEALQHAGSNPSFAQFAYQTIEAAKKLGHTAEVAKLQKAWEDVGVTPSKETKDTLTPERKIKRETPGSVESDIEPTTATAA